MSFDGHLAEGRKGERVFRLWLERQGFFVVWTAEIQTHAPGGPIGTSLEGRTILPDFLASAQGRARWVEVKTKGNPTKYNKTGAMQHGIALRSWNEYLDCEQQSGIEGWLGIFEAVKNLEDRMMLLQTFSNLRQGARIWPDPQGKMGGPMVFFDREDFDWYPAPKDIPFTVRMSEPQSVRTLAQKPAPTTRQFPLFELPDDTRPRTPWDL